ncbi:unnamed protein product [Ranitomeya imitator]|uniref:ribonuclease H n=1 Tax=Ranitomeya imitator TaxID=111125 RepID=A0ABN9L4C1_9NEOB|nr:unnamed protein product [Ranitomeya imitator]
MSEVMAHIREQSILIVPYLDDLLVVGTSFQHCKQQLDLVMASLSSLEWLLNIPKFKIVPSQVQEYLGIVLDSITQKCYLPQGKIQKMTQAVLQLTVSPVTTLRKAMSLLGSMTACIPAVQWAQCHSRDLQWETLDSGISLHGNLDGQLSISSNTIHSLRIFPYVSAMVSNGSLSYDHTRDGRPTELGGCTAMVRNLNHDTFLVIRYVKRRLTIMIDIDGKQEWRDCLDVPGVRLPRGYYFGASAATGDLTDNHDIISLKVYQISVERTPAEEKMDKEVFIPSVDNMKLPGVDDPDESMSGFAVFLIVFFTLIGLVFTGVILLIVYNKWQERSRKHFY